MMEVGNYTSQLLYIHFKVKEKREREKREREEVRARARRIINAFYGVYIYLFYVVLYLFILTTLGSDVRLVKGDTERRRIKESFT